MLRTHSLLGLLATALVVSSAGALELRPSEDPLPPPLPPALPVVPGLNSDFLDGKDASAFLGRNEKAADSELLDGRDSTDFADAVHDHDDRYYTEPESDARFAAAAHDHDGRYLALPAQSLVRGHSAGQCLASEVATRIAYQAEDLDTLDEFADGQFVPESGGVYALSGTVYFRLNVAGNRGAISIVKNGATVSEFWSYAAESFFAEFSVTATDLLPLDAGDTVEFWAYHNGGIDRCIFGGSKSTFSIHRVA